MNMILKPLEFWIYETVDGKKLIITLGYNEYTQIYYYFYSYEDIDDVIVSHSDIEFADFKKKMFVQDRNLKLIKQGEFRK